MISPLRQSGFAKIKQETKMSFKYSLTDQILTLEPLCKSSACTVMSRNEQFNPHSAGVAL